MGPLFSKLVILSSVLNAGAADRLPVKPFLYHESFEDRDPVQFLKGTRQSTRSTSRE